LLVRVDGIGDALVCAPLVAALRDAGHTLGALLTTRNDEAFASKTFERVHVVERIAWPGHGTTPESRTTALAGVCAARYDVALIASEEMDALRFARDARIPTRRGFVNGWEKPFKTLLVSGLLSKPLVRSASAQRVCEHEVETLFRLGANLHREAAPTRDLARLAPLVSDESVEFHGRIVVQLSAKYAQSGLDLAAYAALIGALRASFGTPFVLSDDRKLAAQLQRATGIEVEQPHGLRPWKRWIAGARALVTPDSGASHLAGMLGIPSVVAFAAGPAVARDIVRWKPWAAPSRALVLDPRADRRAFAKHLCNELDALLGYAKAESRP
jgi:ADP-heptose:LPS heptosyltransferase